MTSALANSRFMKAARCEPTDTTPIWIMRQAGRYLPEYMQVRSQVTFIELCKRPDLAAQVTLEAREILGVDAAILFADLLPILEPMGFDLEYAKGEGPVIHNPLRNVDDLSRVRALESPDELGFVFDTVELVRRQLPEDIPLLGFAGAPFTLASYAIEGGGSKNYVTTKTLMYSHPESWHELMDKLTRSLTGYLLKQIEAGCQAVQIFDSWAGSLSPRDYQEYVLPYTDRLVKAMPPDTPVINFLTGNPALLAAQKTTGAAVIGLDWRVDLRQAREFLGPGFAVQGNLDPVTLFADIASIKRRACQVLKDGSQFPGHIFNLGHGVMPGMNPEHVKALVEIVHEHGAGSVGTTNAGSAGNE